IIDLARHAREAMPDGGRLLLETSSVELDAKFLEMHPGSRLGRYVGLSVCDSGHGMDDTTRVRLFEPFFTTLSGRGGMGLGLAAAYGIVKQHAGYIWVENPPGGGTVFRVYLPVHKEAEEEAASDPETLRLRRLRKTVLIGEDQPSVRELAREILEGEGECHDQALARAERHGERSGYS